MSSEQDNAICGANFTELQASLIFFLSVIGIIWTYMKAISERPLIEYRGTDDSDSIALKTATANWRASMGEKSKKMSRLSLLDRVKSEKIAAEQKKAQRKNTDEIPKDAQELSDVPGNPAGGICNGSRPIKSMPISPVCHGLNKNLNFYLIVFLPSRSAFAYQVGATAAQPTEEASDDEMNFATANTQRTMLERLRKLFRNKRHKIDFGLFEKAKVSHNLHHFGFSTDDVNFKEAFKDIKFVICGSNAVTTQRVARYVAEQLSAPVPYGSRIRNLSKKERFAVFKAGPTLCVNHENGSAACSIALHEVSNLLRIAEVESPTYFYLGTSEGLGVEIGSIIITTAAVNALMQPQFEMCSFGTRVKYDSSLDARLVQKLIHTCETMDIDYTTGLTMESNDFYEEEARLDGSLCAYKKEEQRSYLEKLYNHGVRNIQMGCSCFAAFCRRADAKAAIINVCLADRFDENQYPLPPFKLALYEMMPCEVIVHLMKKQLKLA